MANELEGLTVAILATTGFEQAELTEPRKALEQDGATTHLISPQTGGSVKAWDEDDWGETFDVDRPLSEAKASDYDALQLPGGVMNPDHLRTNEAAVTFVKTFFETDKPVAAICHAPWTLIEAGVVKGRRMTSYASVQTDLRNAGADWVDEEVVTDRHLVTSRNPDDLPAFCEAMVGLFAKARRGAEVAG